MNRVRAATGADAPAIRRIDVECWRTTYAGLLPDRMLLGLSAAERARVWANYVARHPGDLVVSVDEADRVRGFGNCGPSRETGGVFRGEIFTLYVATDHQGTGIGRALMWALFGRLVRAGLPSAVIWVLRDNPSRYFYERLGGRLASHRPLRVFGATVEAIAYGWPDLPERLRAEPRTRRLTGEG